MRALAALLLVAGCVGDNRGGGRCEVRTRAQALTSEERKLVGDASPYPADPMLRASQDVLDSSQRARRAAAWDAFGRAIAPVSLAIAAPGGDTLPRWRTWYNADDLHRIFQHVWRGLPGTLRRARAPIPDDALDAGFAWDPTAVDEDPAWSAQRFDDYVASLGDSEGVDGAGGIDRIAYDPSAGRTLLAGYAQEMTCLGDGAPPAFVDGPPTQPVTTRDAFALGACEDQSFGPWFVASGETLDAHAEAAIEAHTDTLDGTVACSAGPGDACEVQGPAEVWIVASADEAAVSGTLVVDTIAPDAPWAGCLASRFPTDAALVKADWRRADLDFTVPVHDTSAPALAAARASNVWTAGEGTANPNPDEIYTVRAENGETFRLTAMHLMTRELDHWLWVSLWWSPDPDSDFGADRPASITGVWSHYKMCVATSFREGDPDPSGGFDGSLGAALAAVSTPGGASWCSNPYLEVGAGEVGTNCVGCHQHGGTGLAPEEIVGDPTRFPDSGRVQVRNNFPVDYSWQSDRGDRLAEMIRDEVTYWDSVP